MTSAVVQAEVDMMGKSRPLKAGGGGHVVPMSEGSHLVMWMELELAGVLKLGTPLLRRRMKAMFQKDLDNSKTRLEAVRVLASSGADDE